MGAFAYHIAVNVVLVGMMVRVNREAIACSGAKQREVGGVRADRLGLAVAADVVIQTDDLVGRGHHQMQVVAYHEHAAAFAFGNGINKGIELRLTRNINALGRFV
jgi:hypothetical protein